jgi:hypothetical protein
VRNDETDVRPISPSRHTTLAAMPRMRHYEIQQTQRFLIPFMVARKIDSTGLATSPFTKSAITTREQPELECPRMTSCDVSSWASTHRAFKLPCSLFVCLLLFAKTLTPLLILSPPLLKLFGIPRNDHFRKSRRQMLKGILTPRLLLTEHQLDAAVKA